MNTVFLEPLDVLFLRGNKLFGEAGSYGESLVPPWPSVAAGALRSRLLADAGVDLAAFADGRAEHPELGKPSAPGSFTVTAFHLARKQADGKMELLVAPPADLVISTDEGGSCHVRPLVPAELSQHGLLMSSAPLPLLPVLAEPERSKPAGSLWLGEAGWRAYLAGQTPSPHQLVQSSELWSIDTRIGVGLEAATRRADDGRLFTVQAVAMREGVGFLAAIAGAQPPRGGTVRLGGDGRAAAVLATDKALLQPDYEAIAGSGRCRLVLATPGLFADGWLPTGARPDARREDGAIRFEMPGVAGWIVCAAVPRAEVISGWDLAARQPKPARRVAPAGSVYWLDALQATPEALRKLVQGGLWSEPCQDAQRRAEGFNRIALAPWTAQPTQEKRP